MFPTNNQARVNTQSNRSFYLYGGHIELTRFKECYGGECARFYILAQFLRALFGAISLNVFLE